MSTYINTGQQVVQVTAEKSVKPGETATLSKEEAELAHVKAAISAGTLAEAKSKGGDRDEPRAATKKGEPPAA